MCVNTWNPPYRTPYPHYGACLVSFYWRVLTWGGPRVASVHIWCYHFPDSIFLLLSENFINLENYTQIKQKDGPRLETHAWQHYTPLPSKEVECVFHVLCVSRFFIYLHDTSLPFLFLLLLFNLLCLRSPFLRLWGRISSSFWLQPLMSRVVPVVCVGFCWVWVGW